MDIQTYCVSSILRPVAIQEVCYSSFIGSDVGVFLRIQSVSYLSVEKTYVVIVNLNSPN